MICASNNSVQRTGLRPVAELRRRTEMQNKLTITVLVLVALLASGCASYLAEQERLSQSYHGQPWEQKPDYWGAHGIANFP